MFWMWCTKMLRYHCGGITNKWKKFQFKYHGSSSSLIIIRFMNKFLNSSNSYRNESSNISKNSHFSKPEECNILKMCNKSICSAISNVICLILPWENTQLWQELSSSQSTFTSKISFQIQMRYGNYPLI